MLKTAKPSWHRRLQDFLSFEPGILARTWAVQLQNSKKSVISSWISISIGKSPLEWTRWQYNTCTYNNTILRPILFGNDETTRSLADAGDTQPMLILRAPCIWLVSLGPKNTGVDTPWQYSNTILNLVNLPKTFRFFTCQSLGPPWNHHESKA